MKVLKFRVDIRGNYYGGLWAKQEDGKYYWLIENYDTDFDDIDEWEEIPKEMFEQLLKYNNL